MKKVSIIIPCYNATSYLDKCIKSLIEQSIGLDELEVILVDDASTDDTLSLITGYQNKYSDSIRALSYEQNGRQGTARNYGLKYATAPYVMFLDSDDWLEKDAVLHMYNQAVLGDYDMVVCRYERDFGDGDMYFENISTGQASKSMTIDTVDKRKAFIFLHPVESTPWGKLIKRSLLIDNEIYFAENIRYEDNLWAPLLFLYVNKIYFLEENLYHYYVNPNSTVLKVNAEYHTDLIKAHILLWDEYVKRGVFKDYYYELTKEYLITCYISFLKVLANRYDSPIYEHYEFLRETVLERIPDFKENPYITPSEIGALHSAIIGTLSYHLSFEELKELTNTVRLSGI